MPTYDYVCPEGHVFDGLYAESERVVPCRGCLGEPGIADGFNEIQLRMARAWILANDIIPEREDSWKAETGYCAAFRCLLAMPSWATKRSTSLNIVVHRDKYGNYRFPGHVNAPVPDGFERIEVDNIHKARRIEKEIRTQEEAKAADIAYRRLAKQDAELAQHESDLKAALRGEAFEVPNEKGEMVKQKGLTDFGKAMVQKGLEKVQEKRKESVSKKIITQAGNIGFEALSYDRSNRDGYRDKTTDWKSVRD